MTEILAVARRLAAASPGSRLPCPLCGVALGSGNLERHLSDVHPGQDDAGTAWRGRGWKGGRLFWQEDALHWRSRTGLRRRSVGPEHVVVAGSTMSSRTVHSSVTNFPDHGGTTVLERSGAYLQVHGHGPPITVRCRTGGAFRKAWTGWEPGERLQTWDVTVDIASFVALSYVLADAGALRPKDAASPG